jgi:hypothetical protein
VTVTHLNINAVGFDTNMVVKVNSICCLSAQGGEYRCVGMRMWVNMAADSQLGIVSEDAQPRLRT